LKPDLTPPSSGTSDLKLGLALFLSDVGAFKSDLVLPSNEAGVLKLDSIFLCVFLSVFLSVFFEIVGLIFS
jgi:hypothetical protein